MTEHRDTGSDDHLSGSDLITPPHGVPSRWARSLRELERWEWRAGDPADPVEGLTSFLSFHGLDGEPAAQRGTTAVGLLAGAAGAAALGGLDLGPASPVPSVPDLVAVACRPVPQGPDQLPGGGVRSAPPGVGPWRTSWSDVEHAAAVEAVRQAIARGELYQANVVGHRAAAHRMDPRELARRVAGLPGATYASVLTGDGWAVGSASPEQLVRLSDGRLTTIPIKGTLPVGPGSQERLLSSEKDRAEHVMIVDLERNDLSRVAQTGTVEVEQLFHLVDWSGLWQATSTVAARIEPGVTTIDVLRAMVPGGSVTGAPKRAAWNQLVALEPVGRGPSMGALGLIWPGGLDLGLTIRTIAATDDTVHLWAGGGITWSSDPRAEVAEAHAKAGPVMTALGR
jgi:para-aminobenzoate synthetase component 1